MKKIILAIAMAATTLTAMPASAQRDDYRGKDRGGWQKEHGGWDKQRGGWQKYRNYDYNRRDPSYNGYYADRYYRDSRYYQQRRLSRNDRIYRGNDGRYYCRRSDGTTGLILGGAIGGLLGNSLDRGGSSILGTLVGAGAGAALGSSIDRGSVNCR